MGTNKKIRWKLFICLEKIDTKLYNSSKKKKRVFSKTAHLQLVNELKFSFEGWVDYAVWYGVSLVSRNRKKHQNPQSVGKFIWMIRKPAVDTRVFGNGEATCFRIWTKFKLTWSLNFCLVCSEAFPWCCLTVWRTVWTENDHPGAVLTH